VLARAYALALGLAAAKLWLWRALPSAGRGACGLRRSILRSRAARL
jgi:hypothetical protein